MSDLQCTMKIIVHSSITYSISVGFSLSMVRALKHWQGNMFLRLLYVTKTFNFPHIFLPGWRLYGTKSCCRRGDGAAWKQTTSKMAATRAVCVSIELFLLGGLNEPIDLPTFPVCSINKYTQTHSRRSSTWEGTGVSLWLTFPFRSIFLCYSPLESHFTFTLLPSPFHPLCRITGFQVEDL